MEVDTKERVSWQTPGNSQSGLNAQKHRAKHIGGLWTHGASEARSASSAQISALTRSESRVPHRF